MSSITVYKWLGAICMLLIAYITDDSIYTAVGMGIVWIGYMIEEATKEIKKDI